MTAKMMIDIKEDRFWAKVATAGPEECWEWTGYCERNGYGRYHKYLVHRVAYELSTGESPGDLLVDHICRNRVCVNPAHLRLVTAKQNSENVSLRRNNTSGFRGVSWHSVCHKWRAQVVHNGSFVYLGLFKTAEAANEVVVAKRRELFTHSDESDDYNIDVSYAIPGRSRQLELF